MDNTYTISEEFYTYMNGSNCVKRSITPPVSNSTNQNTDRAQQGSKIAFLLNTAYPEV